MQFVILGVAAFALSGLLTGPVRALAIKLSVMDLPNMERKTQVEPVPYLGGVAIAISIVSVTYAAIFYSDNTKTTFPLVRKFSPNLLFNFSTASLAYFPVGAIAK